MPAIDWRKLVHFIGYGPRSSANILFLGLEERAIEGPLNLAARSTFEDIEDLRAAHEEKLAPAGVSSPFQHSGNPVQQWNTAAKFALALERHAGWND